MVEWLVVQLDAWWNGRSFTHADSAFDCRVFGQRRLKRQDPGFYGVCRNGKGVLFAARRPAARQRSGFRTRQIPALGNQTLGAYGVDRGNPVCYLDQAVPEKFNRTKCCIQFGLQLKTVFGAFIWFRQDTATPHPQNGTWPGSGTNSGLS